MGKLYQLNNFLDKPTACPQLLKQQLLQAGAIDSNKRIITN